MSGVDVRMQQRVRALANEFNAECNPMKHGERCDIVCRDAALGNFSGDVHFPPRDYAITADVPEVAPHDWTHEGSGYGVLAAIRPNIKTTQLHS